ncbi:hypothetical protein MMA231_04151 (plasmid) [Asticcacaulis sp. MM231]|uniref:endonuclease/exonuclease/phosphatase family protein n=1 Tax=Asticcacaulis sp. MM231 TaxID=3157666 RepID=UPI0032D57E3D
MSSSKRTRKGRGTSRKRFKVADIYKRYFSTGATVYGLAIAVIFILPSYVVFERNLNNLTFFYPYLYPAIVALNLGLAATLKKFRVMAAILTLALAIAFFQVPLRDYIDNQAAPSSPVTRSLQVVTYNWLQTNKNYEGFQQWLIAQQPDIVVIEEVPAVFWKNYPALSTLYPYTNDSKDSNDLAILSRYPIENIEWVPIADRKILSTKINIHGKSITVVAVHPQTILDDHIWERRNTYLAAVAPVVGTDATDTIVLGDFNTSPWNPVYKSLLEDANLHAEPRLLPPLTRILFKKDGIEFGAPIDHIIVSENMTISACRTGDAFGSDHLPLICTVGN